MRAKKIARTKEDCQSCQYSGTVGGMECCNYILIAGHMRKCPARSCTRYKKGQRIKLTDDYIVCADE